MQARCLVVAMIKLIKWTRYVSRLQIYKQQHFVKNFPPFMTHLVEQLYTIITWIFANNLNVVEISALPHCGDIFHQSSPARRGNSLHLTV